MKKQFLLICFLLAAVAGFSQLSKADAASFLSRNPMSKLGGVRIFGILDTASDGVKYTSVTWSSDQVVSITAMESGIQLIVKPGDQAREKFIPYYGIKYLVISGDNDMIFHLIQ